MKKTTTNDVESHHIFGLIVGSSGAGKTSLAKTLPPKETLILSAESGLLSIKGSGHDVWILENSNDLKEAIEEIKKGVKYKNIFIDSLTEIGELIFNDLKPKFNKSQTFGLYDKYREIMEWLIKNMRDMHKYNFYMTALDKMQSKDFTEVVSIDLVQKSLSKKIPAYFDEVLYLTTRTHEEKEYRVLCSDNGEYDFCKDRSGKLNAFEKPDLSAIEQKILGE